MFQKKQSNSMFFLASEAEGKSTVHQFQVSAVVSKSKLLLLAASTQIRPGLKLPLLEKKKLKNEIWISCFSILKISCTFFCFVLFFFVVIFFCFLLLFFFFFVFFFFFWFFFSFIVLFLFFLFFLFFFFFFFLGKRRMSFHTGPRLVFPYKNSVFVWPSALL